MTALATAALPLIKTALRETTSARDAELTALAERAITAIGAYLGRPVVPTTVSQEFLGVCGPMLLEAFPVASITSVTKDGSVLDSGTYRLFSRTGALWKQQGNCLKFWTSEEVLTVVYSGGNYVAPYPEWLMQSVVQTALALEADGGTGVTSDEVRRESIAGVYSVDYGSSGSDSYGILPPLVIDFLQEHRAPGMAHNG